MLPIISKYDFKSFSFNDHPTSTSSTQSILIVGKSKPKNTTVISSIITESKIPIEKWYSWTRKPTKQNSNSINFWNTRLLTTHVFKQSTDILELEELIALQKLHTADKIGIVIDGFDPLFKHNKILDTLLSNAKRWNISIVLSCQYLYNLPVAIHSNVSHMFILSSHRTTLNQLYTNHIRNGIEFQQFVSLVRSLDIDIDDQGRDQCKSLVYEPNQPHFKIYTPIQETTTNPNQTSWFSWQDWTNWVNDIVFMF